MKYGVEWAESAEAELAAAWLASADPASFAQAVDLIDFLLSRDPENQGESRPGGRRIAFEKPVAVSYRIFTDTRLVKVLRVWTY